MRILLAEDDSFMRELLQQVLRSAGHDVVEEPDGQSAWERYQQERFPLALLDWQMPRMDGIELCTRIRAQDPRRETFIIMITARDAHEDLQRVLDAGADDYISKPVTPDNLNARVAIAVRRIAQEAARRAAEDELARAKYLAGIGEMSLALQHEINNPLAALLGNASLIESGLCAPDEVPDTIAVIVQQAQRIAAVVKRLAALQNPKSVEYLQGARMVDLSSQSGEHKTPPKPRRKKS